MYVNVSTPMMPMFESSISIHNRNALTLIWHYVSETPCIVHVYCTRHTGHYNNVCVYITTNRNRKLIFETFCDEWQQYNGRNNIIIYYTRDIYPRLNITGNKPPERRRAVARCRRRRFCVVRAVWQGRNSTSPKSHYWMWKTNIIFCVNMHYVGKKTLSPRWHFPSGSFIYGEGWSIRF